MKRKMIAWLCLLAFAATAAGCNKKEEAAAEQTTTLTGMVVSVDGTVVNLMEMSTDGTQGNWGGQRPSGEGSQRPSGGQRPEGNFTMPEDFTMPEGGFTMPEDFTMPEGGFNPEDFNGEMPEGMTRPEGSFNPENFNGQMPEGMTRPEGGMPSFGGSQTEVQTTPVDLKNAHISIQDGDIKAAGSISDIKVGCMLTITLNGNGEATEVLVTSSGFSGGNFGGFGGGNFGGNRGNRGQGGSKGGTDQT